MVVNQELTVPQVRMLGTRFDLRAPVKGASILGMTKVLSGECDAREDRVRLRGRSRRNAQ
jgi:hypothetical protein